MKTCARGHPYTPHNRVQKYHENGTKNGTRCRICDQEQARRWVAAHCDHVRTYKAAYRQRLHEEDARRLSSPYPPRTRDRAR